MHIKGLLIGLLYVLVLSHSVESLGISGKLDFGDAHSSPSLRTEESHYKELHVPVKYKTIKTVETGTKDDFDTIGVVCVTGGCNTTKINEAANDSIQTDVVVHIQTKVDLNQNDKSKTIIDDTPDIPVVVGYGGAKLDSTVEENEENGHSVNPQTIVVTNLDPFSNSAYPSNQNSFVPSTIGVNPPSISSRIDSSLNNMFNNPLETFYMTPFEDPKVEIKIKTIPSVTVMTAALDGSKNHVPNVRYKNNGIELHVPYFEPTFNNHYFGEHPPQPLVWYPKKNSVFNPVEFRNIPKSTWNPSYFNTRTPSYHNKHHHTTDNCNCKNQATTPGLQWYPNRRTFNNDPGSQINDKLAPLN